jgi:hypothetical protein
MDACSRELEPGAFPPEPRAELLEGRSRLFESFPGLSLSLLLLTKAITDPSGDQAGDRPLKALAVSRVSPVPSAFMM